MAEITAVTHWSIRVRKKISWNSPNHISQKKKKSLFKKNRKTTTAKLLARAVAVFLELKFTLVEIVEVWAARASWPVDCTHHDGLQNLQALLDKPPTKTRSCSWRAAFSTASVILFLDEIELICVCWKLILSLSSGQWSTQRGLPSLLRLTSVQAIFLKLFVFLNLVST